MKQLRNRSPGRTERRWEDRRSRFFISGFFNKDLQTIGTLLSFVALMLTIAVAIVTIGIYAFYQGEDPDRVSQIWTAIGVLGVFCVIALTLAVFIASKILDQKNMSYGDIRKQINLQRSVDEQDEVFRMLETLERNVSLDKRRVSLRVRNLYSEGADTSQVLQRVLGNWRKFTDSYVDICRSIMEVATGESCCCCVKLLTWADHEGSQPEVRTLMRDQHNRRNRVYTDTEWPSYPASSNSAYSKLMNDPTFDGVYVSDDLSGDGSYLNSNQQWARFYNSTLVAPIGSEHFKVLDNGHDEHLGYDLIGFLCFDSKKAAFASERCAYLSKLLASYYNEYLNYIARTFFVLNDEQLIDLFIDLPDNAESLEVLAKLNKSRERIRENRPLGIFMKRAYIGPGAIGVEWERTPMIIHRMFREWSNRSMP